MRKIVFNFIVLIGVCFNIQYYAQATIGQTTSGIIKIPTPESANLGKFIDAPVSLNKGIPQINIPLYTISVDDFNFPINLDYYAGGVRVDETSSWVGLGWKLSADAVVIRQQRGNPDEIGFFGTNSILNFINSSPENQNQLGLDYNYNSTTDYEADVFSFSVGNLSGKFYYDQLKQQFIDDTGNKNKIEFTSDGNWKITDNIGTIFEFKLFDYTDTSYSIGGNLTHDENAKPKGKDIWRLIKITTPSNKEILFSYVPQIQSQYYLPTVASHKFLLNSLIDWDTPPGSCFQNNSIEENRQLNTENSFSLSQITTDKETVNFTLSSEERKDADRLKNLTAIEIRNKNDALIKKYEFVQSFIRSVGGAEDQYNYRMYLDQINSIYPNNTVELYRKFSYINRNRLPQKFSASVDYWGFSNNKNNNSLIPENIIKFKDNHNVLKDIVIEGGDRKVDTLYAQDGTLNKITLPTLGEIKYTYESNWSVGDSINADTRKLLNPIKIDSLSFSKSPDFIVDNYQNNYKYQIKFTVPPNPIKTTFEINVTGCDNSGINQAICNYQFAIFEDKGSATDYIHPLNGLLLHDEAGRELPAGDYILGARPMDNDNDVSNYFNIQFYNISEIILDKYLIGGLRIKSVELDDKNDSKITKNYNYNYFNSNTPSGRIQSIPTYSKIYTESKKCKIPSPGGGASVYINYDLKVAETKSVPNISLYDETNAAIYYENVTENVVDSKNPLNTYKSEYKFSYVKDSVSNASSTPYTLPTYSLNNKRGNLLEKSDYKRSNNALTLIKTETYDYQYYERILSNYALFLKDENTSDIQQYAIRVSYMKPVYHNSINILNGKNLVSNTNYYYDTSHHYQLTSQSDLLSDGTSKETLYNYAYEKGNQYLIDKNMIGIPLETVIINKKNSLDVGKITSQTSTSYPASVSDAKSRIINNSGNKDFALPFDVLSKDLGNLNMLKEVNFDYYDNKGNLLQYTTKEGIPTVIIWGYNQTEPIAKIEGSTYPSVTAKTTDISQSLIDAIVSASDFTNANYSETDLINALDTFRKDPLMANFQITTYTYDPLIGVTSITPPSGIREIYKYDSANRLQSVVDIDGKILKEYKYNYKP